MTYCSIVFLLFLGLFIALLDRKAQRWQNPHWIVLIHWYQPHKYSWSFSDPCIILCCGSFNSQIEVLQFEYHTLKSQNKQCSSFISYRWDWGYQNTGKVGTLLLRKNQDREHKVLQTIRNLRAAWTENILPKLINGFTETTSCTVCTCVSVCNTAHSVNAD